MNTGTDGHALPDMGGNGDLATMQRQIAHVMEENQLLVKTVRSCAFRKLHRSFKHALA